jgi:hypothetical protein
MDNGLVTSDETKVLTVAEYDRFVNFISEVEAYFRNKYNYRTSVRGASKATRS